MIYDKIANKISHVLGILLQQIYFYTEIYSTRKVMKQGLTILYGVIVNDLP